MVQGNLVEELPSTGEENMLKPKTLEYEQVEHLPHTITWSPDHDAMVWTFTFVDGIQVKYVALNKLHLID